MPSCDTTAPGEDGMRGFGDLEAVIMDRLWSWNRPVTVREVVDDLRAYRDIAYTTVMTVMDNLHRKGAVTREKEGRAWLYQPVRSRDEYAADLLSSVLDEAGDRGAALMRFVGRMRPSEVDALRRALAERQNRRRRT
jgi:predicted transcriptional regulator